MEKNTQEHDTRALRCEYCPEKRAQYKGIRMRKWGSWGSEIRMPKTRTKIWLGSYKTAEQAARAYDAAAYCLRGSNANFNFPDSVPSIPSAFSVSPRQIKLLASRYARDELPSTSPSLHSNNHDNGVSHASSSRSSLVAETELWNNCEQIPVERGSWVSLFDSSGCFDFQTVASMNDYSALDSFPTWQEEKQDGYISRLVELLRSLEK